MTAFSPREIVSELDSYVFGQKKGKCAFAKDMRIAGEICDYTNTNVVIESIEA